MGPVVVVVVPLYPVVVVPLASTASMVQGSAAGCILAGLEWGCTLGTDCMAAGAPGPE